MKIRIPGLVVCFTALKQSVDASVLLWDCSMPTLGLSAECWSGRDTTEILLGRSPFECSGQAAALTRQLLKLEWEIFAHIYPSSD